MNIDERLTRIMERHEALTGHIEMLTADLGHLKERMEDLTANVERQRRTMDDLMVGCSTLAVFARSRENSIERLEGRKRI